MNDARQKGVKVDYRQMLIFGVLALAVVYHFSRPTLERWFGTQLPSITEDDRQSQASNHNYDAKLPNVSGKSSNSASSNSASSNQSSNPGQAARDWLKDIGGNKYQSPAGLIYTGGREHRVDHVLRHCVDDPSKPTHGVFVGDAVAVMKMVDEAYEMVKAGSRKVDSDKQGDKMTHTCEMGRVVGHTGGRKAERSGRKELRSVKLVLADNRVITAYPTK
jgi:hypothetical protein